MDILEFRDRLDRLRSKKYLTSLLARVIRDSVGVQVLIENLNRAQLDRGRLASGEVMPDYSPVSVLVYDKPPGPIRLLDTGDFWESIIAEVQGDVLSIEATDRKTKELQYHYGTEILGLSIENQNKLIERLRAELTKEIHKLLST